MRSFTTVIITIGHIEECPHWEAALTAVRRAVEALGITATIETVLVSSEAEAGHLDLHGSPTIQIDGVDPFAAPDHPISLACRLFPTPDGLAGVPTFEQLRSALASARPAT